MADRLTVAPGEIVVVSGDTKYVLAQITGINFVYAFIYYEPENGNSFKVLDIDDELIRVDLTEEDITNLQAVIADTDTLEANLAEPFEVPEEDTPEEPAPSVHLVDADGQYVGDGQLKDGYTAADSMPPQGSWLGDFGVEQRWNGSAWGIQGGYSAERRARYLEEVGISNQIAALMNAVNALANGEAISSEFTDLYTQISTIKSDIPKE